MNKLTNDEVLERFYTFTEDKFSLIVSTSDTNNTPLTNYSPFVQKDNKYYICVSSSLPHFTNMKEQEKAHIMILQDEQNASHIYARERLYFNASCVVLEDANSIYELFDARYGESLSFIKSMGDFKVIELTPKEQSFVLGFGAAYVIDEAGKLKNKTISHQK